MPSGKITYTNRRENLICIMLEPWGEDYWIQPGETFEFVPMSAREDSFFAVVDHGRYVAVFAEGRGGIITVYHAGRKLKCGHNRPADAFKAHRRAG